MSKKEFLLSSFLCFCSFFSLLLRAVEDSSSLEEKEAFISYQQEALKIRKENLALDKEAHNKKILEYYETRRIIEKEQIEIEVKETEVFLAKQKALAAAKALGAIP
jgi:hypothetical protein